MPSLADPLLTVLAPEQLELVIPCRTGGPDVVSRGPGGEEVSMASCHSWVPHRKSLTEQPTEYRGKYLFSFSFGNIANEEETEKERS